MARAARSIIRPSSRPSRARRTRPGRWRLGRLSLRGPRDGHGHGTSRGQYPGERPDRARLGRQRHRTGPECAVRRGGPGDLGRLPGHMVLLRGWPSSAPTDFLVYLTAGVTPSLTTPAATVAYQPGLAGYSCQLGGLSDATTYTVSVVSMGTGASAAAPLALRPSSAIRLHPRTSTRSRRSPSLKGREGFRPGGVGRRRFHKQA